MEFLAANSLSPFIYVLFFVIAATFAIVINQLLLKFLKDLGNRNTNNENLIRWAAQTKPAIGGFSFFTLFLLSVCAYVILPLPTDLLIDKWQMFGLISSATLGFLFGLIDDSYNTPPSFKFFGQLGCSALIILSGVTINFFGIWLLDAALTTFWVVGIMNSINMLDNMDGITASVSAFICLATLILLSVAGTLGGGYTIIILGVLASLVGFLFFNWYPAKMYMGDTSSQFLGAFLSFISILFMWILPNDDSAYRGIGMFILPALAFLLPLIDTTTVFIRRIARGDSPFQGGRDHTTHHLAYCGLKDYQVGYVFVALSIFHLGLIYGFIATFQAFYIPLAVVYCIGLFGLFQLSYNHGKKRLAEREKEANIIPMNQHQHQHEHQNKKVRRSSAS